MLKSFSADYLRSRMSYDKDTGIFTWLVGKRFRGQVAGCITKNGYWYIRVDGKNYFAHRLAWLHATGKWPEKCIDHINGNRSDNRLCNLREATHAQNSMNRPGDRISKTGLKGVYVTKGGVYRASIMAHGRIRRLGSFDDAASAHKAYAAAAAELHGAFARTS